MRIEGPRESPAPPDSATLVAPSDASQPGRDEPSPFARLLHGLGREVEAGERTIRETTAALRAGRDLGAAEMILLQAAVYRYSEVVDLASKLVDRASYVLKTVLGGSSS